MASMEGKSLQTARAEYFARNGLPPDGGYQAEWVHVRVGPFPFRFRNSPGRRRIAPAHDLHHVLTGYATSLVGEGEIGCFEIGSGLRDRTGLWLSLRVIGFVVPVAPRRLLHAFVRGRRSGNLLGRPIGAELLGRSVDAVRRDLALAERSPRATWRDVLAFLPWSFAGVAIVWGPLALLGALWLALA